MTRQPTLADFPPRLSLADRVDRCMAVDLLLAVGDEPLAEAVRALTDPTAAVLLGGTALFRSDLHAAVERRDEAAVRNLLAAGGDLAPAWLDGTDADRDWLFGLGILNVDSNITVVGTAENYREVWHEREGGAWPRYHLVVSAAGCQPFGTSGWHTVTAAGVATDGDGSGLGLPGLRDEDGDRNDLGWTLHPGDNLDDAPVVLPVWRAGGLWATFDRDTLAEALAAAADAADHGAAPTWQDVDEFDAGSRDVWLIRGGDLVATTVCRGGLLPTTREVYPPVPPYNGSTSETTYHVTAWAALPEVPGVDPSYATEAELLAALVRVADDGGLYFDEDEACAAECYGVACAECGVRGLPAPDPTDYYPHQLVPDPGDPTRYRCAACREAAAQEAALDAATDNHKDTEN